MLCLLWNSRNFKGNYGNKDGSLNCWGEWHEYFSFLSVQKPCRTNTNATSRQLRITTEKREQVWNQIGRENKPGAYSKFCQQVLEFALGVKAHKTTE